MNKNPTEYTELGFTEITKLIPDAVIDMRYYSSFNFVGERINLYEAPVAILTKEAAEALRVVSIELRSKGYLIKIYDAYRPQSAVYHFLRWANDARDTRMKQYFYPDTDKSRLIEKGYIAERSGHSRGSSVDLTLVDMATGKEVDMGSEFDYFGEISRPSYTATLTDEQIRNRRLLREAMTGGGFAPDGEEWWHFSLENEPYPNTYFDFPVA